MQTDDPTLEESPQRHAVPTVIVCVPDDKPRKHEKEIYGQIAMIDHLHQMIACRMGFEQMEGNHHQCCHATQAVQNLVVGLRGKVSSLRFHKNVCLC